MQTLRRGPLLWLTYAALSLGALFMLFPFVWMVLSSFKGPQEMLLVPPTFIPENPTLDNYVSLWGRFKFATYFANSLGITVITVAANLYTAALFGFVLAKYRFRARTAIFWLVMLCMMVPATINVVPLYQLMLWLGWVNTYQSVIVPNLLTVFGVFMIRQFSFSIPDELLEAARLDGAGEWRLFHQICLPMYKNPLAALAILQFLWSWDSYLWPLLMLTDEAKYTLPLGLSALNGQYSTAVEKVLTGASIAVIPVLVVYLLLQRRIVEGLSGASVKG